MIEDVVVGDVRLYETPYKHVVRHAVIRQTIPIRTSETCALSDSEEGSTSEYVGDVRSVISIASALYE